MEKEQSIIFIFLGDEVLLEVPEETTSAGLWLKLESLYMTNSLTKKLYLRKKTYIYILFKCKDKSSSKSTWMNLIKLFLI